MGLLKSAPREGVAQKELYPEPWWITRSRRASFWYRFWTGRPMDGVRWTNSTFWKSGTEGEDHTWLRLAGWMRAAIRVVGTWLTLVLLAVTGLVGIRLLFGGPMPWRFLAGLLIAHAVLISPLLLLVERYFIRERGLRLPMRVEEVQELTEEQELELKGEAPVERHWRMVWVLEGRRAWEEELVEPVAAVAAEVLNLSHQRAAREWVEVPRNYAEPGGHPVEIMLPKRFTASDAKKKQLLQAVKPRLGMMELEDRWLLSGRHPRLQLAAPPAPPEEALYADYREQILAVTEEYRPALGVVAGGELLQAEMISDSPHIALSAGSGAGKSRMGGFAAAQALHWGWSLIVLDWKEESYEWAHGLPGVRYYSNTQAIHDACVSIGEEVERRKAMSKEERERLPKMLIVCEEWNMTAALLSEYWSAYRSMSIAEARANGEPPPILPVRSPALSGLMMLWFAGRAFGMFGMLKAQRMSNRVFNGNTDIRENFNIRLLARYTLQTWRLLLPHLKFMRKPKQVGGWVVAAGDEAAYVQGILCTDEELRELATSGVDNPASPWALSQGNSGMTQRLNVDTEVDLALDGSLGHDPAGPSAIADRPAPVMLRKLVDIALTLEYLGVTEEVLRNWRKREPDFPPTRGGSRFSGWLYDVAEVTEWARQKRATQAAEKEVRA